MVVDLAVGCAGRTPAKGWILASTIARKASRLGALLLEVEADAARHLRLAA